MNHYGHRQQRSEEDVEQRRRARVKLVVISLALLLFLILIGFLLLLRVCGGAGGTGGGTGTSVGRGDGGAGTAEKGDGFTDKSPGSVAHLPGVPRGQGLTPETPAVPASPAAGHETPTVAKPAAQIGESEKASDIQLVGVLSPVEPPAPLPLPPGESEVGPADKLGSGSGENGGGPGGAPLGTGEVSFRIYWQPRREDVDLHVIDPNGHVLDFNHRRCDCEGELDRDDTTSGGPENIYWPEGKGPKGDYTYYAVYFAGSGQLTVTFEVRRHGKIVETYTAPLNRKGEATPQLRYKVVKE